MKTEQKTIKVPSRVYDRVMKLAEDFDLPKSTVVDLAVRAFSDAPVLREPQSAYEVSEKSPPKKKASS